MSLSLMMLKSLKKIFREVESRSTHSSVYPLKKVQKEKKNYNKRNFFQKNVEKNTSHDVKKYVP